MFSHAQALFLFHHVFLPPKTPQEDDFDPQFGHVLFDAIQGALVAFRDLPTGVPPDVLEPIMDMLKTMRLVHDPSTHDIVESALQSAIHRVVEDGGIVPMFVRAQNAAVIIRKTLDGLSFDFFEVLPNNEAVMNTQGRLIRSFPDSSLVVDLPIAADYHFQEQIAATLALMGHQSVPGQQPQVLKAGKLVDEDRDTTHPGMVTEFFRGIIAGIGRFVPSQSITKHTREQVAWSHARLPWRRSPMFLLLRVSLHLACVKLSSSSQAGHVLYKHLMVYLLSHILQNAPATELPSEVLYAMNAKIARRVNKLPNMDPALIAAVRKTTTECHRVISDRWLLKQEAEKRDLHLASLEQLRFEEDTLLHLPEMEAFVDVVQNHRPVVAPTDFRPASDLVVFQSNELPVLLDNDSSRSALGLHVFEEWIAVNLNRWQERHCDSESCVQLAHLLQTYHVAADRIYAGNPEAKSIMVLVCLEIWTACDRIANAVEPFLGEYNPDIPAFLLQNLLLPRRCHLERLSTIEEYLEKRSLCRHPSAGIWKDLRNPQSFAARYFDGSSDHQEMQRRILARAAETKRQKLAQWEALKAEYSRLMELHYSETACETIMVWDKYAEESVSKHSPSCRKCRYQRTASNLRIDIHEWPLPQNTVEAKTIVFELKPPKAFAHWRDALVYMRHNVLGTKYISRAGPRASYPLSNHNDLCSEFQRSGPQRIGLLSQNKPHLGTHRRGRELITSDASNVCLSSGLTYKYFDHSSGCFVGHDQSSHHTSRACTYQMPSSSSVLQKFIWRPSSEADGPPPNTIIASQSDCPDHMTLAEYKDLSSIPLGLDLQWRDIAAHLSSPTIDLQKDETAIVLLQCAYQTGPPSEGGNPLRAAHRLFQEKNFCERVLDGLRISLLRIKKNWECVPSLDLFILLARRTLSVTPHPDIQQACIVYLAEARAVAMDWIRQLQTKLQGAQEENARVYFRRRCVETALICASSFDVDERFQSQVLTTSEASILLQCSILVYYGRKCLDLLSSARLPLLRHRHRCMLFDLHHALRERHAALDHAVSIACVSYSPGPGWALEIPTSHWMVSVLTSGPHSTSFKVHIDLLTGELLVNGTPLDRLPRQYEEHEVYQTLFGLSALEVVPSKTAGMAFASKSEWQGYALEFGMTGSSASPDLLLRARSKQSAFTLVPRHVFRDTIADAFVDEYVHWYDECSGTVEFRPSSDPWNSRSTKRWILQKPDGQTSWQLRQDEDGYSLIGLKTSTSEQVSAVFAPIAKPCQIHLYVDRSDGALKIEFQGLSLCFHLRQGCSQIRSREFKDMVVAGDQSVGTLVGFFNKLVLNAREGSHRVVILAEGQMSLHGGQQGGSVIPHQTISPCAVSLTSAPTRTHAYHVDGRLGQLVGNGGLDSQLLLAYLHAVTSFCLVDPLTNRTGTEQALTILNSAAVKSFSQLTAENARTLELIAQLTPRRSFYPLNERVMEEISWCPSLDFISQHPGFYRVARALFRLATRQHMLFQERQVQFPELEKVDSFLLGRDSIRSSTFRVSKFGAEDFTTDKDVTYSSRKGPLTAMRAADAQAIANMVMNNVTTLHWSAPSHSDLWKFLGTVTTVNGPAQALNACWSRYDARYIKNGATFVAENWPGIHVALTSPNGRRAPDKFALAIFLSTLACSDISRGVLGTIILLYTDSYFASLIPPQRISFEIRLGADACRLLRGQIRSHFYRFEETHEGHGKPKTRSTRLATYEARCDAAATFVESELKDQWPCRNPRAPQGHSSLTYIRMNEMMRIIESTFSKCHDNMELQDYLRRMQSKVASAKVSEVHLSSPMALLLPIPQSAAGFVAHQELFQGHPPNMSSLPTFRLGWSTYEVRKKFTHLQSFLGCLQASSDISQYKKAYFERLDKSLIALENGARESCGEAPGFSILAAYQATCQQTVQLKLEELLAATENTDKDRMAAYGLSRQLGQYPRLDIFAFVQQLNHDHWPTLEDGWKKCLIDFGKALVGLQRAERLADASAAGKTVDVVKELRNEGHSNWDPFMFPDMLLLEIESNITVRDVQAQIAAEMREPPESRNSSMQLNMGEGKSSVIVPAVAAALADGSRLLRVIVAKPQSKQMAQMLIEKLGGLLNRQVYYLPFSRNLILDEATARSIDAMCRECQVNGGVLLVQPEHLLSFQLMTLERSICGETAVSGQLQHTHRYFDQHARDIVDESDENFNVKFELIYTMGTQRQLDFCPDRWSTIAELLQLVKEVGPDIARALPSSIEVEEGAPGSFPRTRILRPDAGEMLVSRIAERVCSTGLAGFPLPRQKESVRRAVFKYITDLDLSAADIRAVETDDGGGFWVEAVRPKLLLLRGLLACGVLVFALARKRYTVNYGRDRSRRPPSQLAVPYRAKDQPSPRSDFSHPDVTISLTYLSYYYGHLSNTEMYMAFENLFKSDNRNLEYEEWIKGVELPEAFRHLQGINLKDGPTCTSVVFPALRKSKVVIDFYLSTVVFPKELREFPHKLCASGWDIGRSKNHPTTAFSGTCDSYPLLPLDMTHLDLPEQQHTNALVLDYLLRSENTVLLLPPKVSRQSYADMILGQVMAQSEPPRVILDVGAQILDRSNKEMARSWLALHGAHSAEAVIFFENDDRLCVLDRRGAVESLLTSPFAGRMDACLVFLDEAHTRGTDLKLPMGYRAAVTLGPGLTKDRLVQACMRMRQLGQGQTVVLTISVEIQRKIRECRGLSDDANISVSDALYWSITQTHEDTQRGMPLWMRQGFNFDRQQSLWSECVGSSALSKTCASLFLEEEAKPLEARYRPTAVPRAIFAPSPDEGPRLSQIVERCRQMEMSSHFLNNMEEEQEKELSPEMEEERQTERPPPAAPAEHNLHADVVEFAVEGHFKTSSPAYIPAFKSLLDISAAEAFDVDQLVNSELFVTKDFARTVEASDSSKMDSYLRSVQWILTLDQPESSCNAQPALIVSPYEAQQLVSKLEKRSASTLHIYKPRWNTTLPALNKLDFFNCPTPDSRPMLTAAALTQLDLFAGRTHFATREEYLETCKFLNLASRPANNKLITGPDGFILQDADSNGESCSRLEQSPVPFVKALTNIRAHYRDFEKTGMGKMLGGMLLSDDDISG